MREALYEVHLGLLLSYRMPWPSALALLAQNSRIRPKPNHCAGNNLLQGETPRGIYGIANNRAVQGVHEVLAVDPTALEFLAEVLLPQLQRVCPTPGTPGPPLRLEACATLQACDTTTTTVNQLGVGSLSTVSLESVMSTRL